MHIKDYARAEGWFRKHAAAPSSKGAWKAFVARNKRAEEPRTMAQGGRIGFSKGLSARTQNLITMSDLSKLDLPYAEATLSNIFSSKSQFKK